MSDFLSVEFKISREYLPGELNPFTAKVFVYLNESFTEGRYFEAEDEEELEYIIKSFIEYRKSIVNSVIDSMKDNLHKP